MDLPPLLNVPGYTGSGPGHWQSLWEVELDRCHRVEQEDWDRPNRDRWVATLEDAVVQSGPSVVLVAHSLGCATVAHWAGGYDEAGQVLGAMLVAPADVDTDRWPPEVTGFRPMPLAPLPFPSLVVASRNDPWVSPERARTFARTWGSDYVDIGPKGHLNTAADLGSWEEGLGLLKARLDIWTSRADTEQGGWA